MLWVRVNLAVLLAALVLMVAAPPGLARGASRGQIEAFLTTTGFDVALASIALSAEGAPLMLGMQPDAFGADWARLTGQVFETARMHADAVDILEETLAPDDLVHAAEFYASDLGARLVEIENAAHLHPDSDKKQAEGRQIVADLVARSDPRVAIFQRMNAAIGSEDSAVRAVEEIQVRFLMAAAAAGVIELRMDESDLREALAEGRAALRAELAISALAGAAWTYRDISDDDLILYAEALEHPKMRRVYELLNAVQHEIMANRFEILAVSMADIYPQQDL